MLLEDVIVAKTTMETGSATVSAAQATSSYNLTPDLALTTVHPDLLVFLTDVEKSPQDLYWT